MTKRSNYGNYRSNQKSKGNSQSQKPYEKDIFLFPGEKPCAINLEHVTQINVEDRKITFQFYSTAMSIDFETEEATKQAFDKIINVWVSDVFGESNGE